MKKQKDAAAERRNYLGQRLFVKTKNNMHVVQDTLVVLGVGVGGGGLV